MLASLAIALNTFQPVLLDEIKQPSRLLQQRMPTTVLGQLHDGAGLEAKMKPKNGLDCINNGDDWATTERLDVGEFVELHRHILGHNTID